MINTISITYKNNYVEAISDGAKNIEFVYKLWNEIIRTCKEHKCFNILGIANTTSPVTINESIKHVELFKNLGLTDKYRIAWVELNPVHRKTTVLIESILSSHGVNCKTFTEVADAKEWIFYASST